MDKKSWIGLSEMEYFSLCSKCKAIAEGICTAQGIGRGTSGSSSPGNWNRERIDCIMSKCCHWVAETHLWKGCRVLPVRILPVDTEISLLYKRC